MSERETKRGFAPKCTYCGSEEIKKRFLAIPNVFSLDPSLIGGVWIAGGTIAVIHGMASARPLGGAGPHNWLVEVIVGLIVVLTAVVGLIAKTHKCLSCGKGFYPLERHVFCPNCASLLPVVDEHVSGRTEVCSRCEFKFVISDNMMKTKKK